ncbi:serine hydrolase domain-containing protein [Paraburkholderia phenazinium]|uniref:serine hydrolase domain-containing protein n=1 Tax=Paraburkholderia phenazinium TaxID=60549 RepID=UPI00158ADBF9
MQDDTTQGDNAAWLPWWSYTKTALAAAALVLVSENRLYLDEPVRGRSFTLRHLLQHRAGLPEYGHLAAYHAAVEAGETPWPVPEMLQQVQANKLMFEPGRGWAYSNVGYLLVRELIEEAIGMSIGPTLDRLVFDPLDIPGAWIANIPADLDTTIWGNPMRYHPGWVYHGLLIGTAASAALLLHRLLEGWLLAPILLAEMLAPCPVCGPIPPAPLANMRLRLGSDDGYRRSRRELCRAQRRWSRKHHGGLPMWKTGTQPYSHCFRAR